MVLEMLTETIGGIGEAFGGIGDSVISFVTEKPITTTALGIGVVGVGTTVGILAVNRKRAKKKTSKRGRKRDRIFKSKQKHEQKYKRKKKYKVYGKKGWIKPKKRSSKKTKKRVGKIYHTKKGQPYKILSSGKARFIKKGGKR